MDRLQAALTDQIYLDPELNLPKLANRLRAPEHRVRKLINQDLGYRNFRTFINEHRVAATKAALADPARADESITALALSAGFASLPSFNRVFKDMTGDTPSAWRQKNIST